MLERIEEFLLWGGTFLQLACRAGVYEYTSVVEFRLQSRIISGCPHGCFISLSNNSFILYSDLSWPAHVSQSLSGGAKNCTYLFPFHSNLKGSADTVSTCSFPVSSIKFPKFQVYNYIGWSCLRDSARSKSARSKWCILGNFKFVNLNLLTVHIWAYAELQETACSPSLDTIFHKQLWLWVIVALKHIKGVSIFASKQTSDRVHERSQCFR